MIQFFVSSVHGTFVFDTLGPVTIGGGWGPRSENASVARSYQKLEGLVSRQNPEAMRYKVMYDDLVAKWAVVDSKAAGLVIAYHKHKEAACAEAQAKEDQDRSSRMAG